MKIALFAYAALAATSTLLYGFAGITLWAPLTSDDGFRMIVLFAAHIMAIPAIALAVEME